MVSLAKGQGLPGLAPLENPFVAVLEINNANEFWIALAYLSIFYITLYFSICSLLEYNNPWPKNKLRIANIKREIMFGTSALFFVMIYTCLWYWKIDKLTPYYGYWQGRENEFGLYEMAKQTVIYLVWFDFWFYATHAFLHIDFFFDRIHKYHHSFYEPSAFAQDAVHPFEAIIQGPMIHLGITLLYPMNPLLISVLGLLTSIYAQCAHDSRSLDISDHVKHHHYRNCNFGLYWGLWDYVFGTRYHPSKYPIKYVPSYEIMEAKIKKED